MQDQTEGQQALPGVGWDLFGSVTSFLWQQKLFGSRSWGSREATGTCLHPNAGSLQPTSQVAAAADVFTVEAPWSVLLVQTRDHCKKIYRASEQRLMVHKLPSQHCNLLLGILDGEGKAALLCRDGGQPITQSSFPIVKPAGGNARTSSKGRTWPKGTEKRQVPRPQVSSDPFLKAGKGQWLSHQHVVLFSGG